MLIVKHDRHVIRVAAEADADGDLHIFTTTSGLHLTPDEQDQLIQHLMAVRGRGRVQQLLNQPLTERSTPDWVAATGNI